MRRGGIRVSRVGATKWGVADVSDFFFATTPTDARPQFASFPSGQSYVFPRKWNENLVSVLLLWLRVEVSFLPFPLLHWPSQGPSPLSFRTMEREERPPGGVQNGRGETKGVGITLAKTQRIWNMYSSRGDFLNNIQEPLRR